MELYYILLFSCLNIRVWKTFSIKDRIVNLLGFMCHIIYVTTTQLYCHENYHRQYTNEWVWLCSNKTLFVDNEI